MSLKYIFSAFILFNICTITLPSCTKCEQNCSTAYNVVGASLVINDTLLSTTKIDELAIIDIEPIIDKVLSKSNCKLQNEISCTVGGFSLSDIHLYCDRDLTINRITYKKNTDLIQYAELLYYKNLDDSTNISLPSVLFEVSPMFEKGRYNFLLQGQTKEGITFEDVKYFNLQIF